VVIEQQGIFYASNWGLWLNFHIIYDGCC